jgi:hypothetical protein
LSELCEFHISHVMCRGATAETDTRAAAVDCPDDVAA